MKSSPMPKPRPLLDLPSCVTRFKGSPCAYSIAIYPPYRYLSPRAASKLWPPTRISQLTHEPVR